MAEMVGLSKSRFHVLMKQGVFPLPVQNESCKRPVFDLKLQQKCLEIRRTGIGENGKPVLFNRKRRKGRQVSKPVGNEHAEIVEALKSLGLAAPAEAVAEALRQLYPGGFSQVDQGEVIRQVFLRLQGRK